MRTLVAVLTLLVVACSSTHGGGPSSDLHAHAAESGSLTTTIFAPIGDVSQAVPMALTQAGIAITDAEYADGWGRVHAVAASGAMYTITWEPTMATGDGNEWVKVFISHDSPQPGPALGGIADAIRIMAEGLG